MIAATDALVAGFTTLLGHLGQVVSVVPNGTGTPFAASLLVGQPTSTVAIIEPIGGLSDDQRIDAQANRTAWAAGFLASTGTSRDPRRNDMVIVAAGEPHAGTWTVERTTVHQGGIITLSLRNAAVIQAAGPGATEVN